LFIIVVILLILCFWRIKKKHHIFAEGAFSKNIMPWSGNPGESGFSICSWSNSSP